MPIPSVPEPVAMWATIRRAFKSRTVTVPCQKFVTYARAPSGDTTSM